MLLIWLSVWLILWSAIGNGALVWVGYRDPLERALLAPITGLAIAIFAATSLNLFGLPMLEFAIPLAVGLFIVGVWYSAVKMRIGWLDHAYLAAPLLIAAVCVAVIGSGFWLFGSSWLGFVNEDGATNALAASYFMRHAFFAAPDAISVLNGTDFSPLASMQYVAFGHRFGDVMLLGLSASISGMQPDEIYMAHGLLLHVALIAAAASLAYHGARPVLNVICAIAALGSSSIGSYTFFNQLISQIGGVALIVLALLLWIRILDVQEKDRQLDWRTVTLFSVAIAAELRSYPEALSILGLAIVIAVAAKGWVFLSAHGRSMAKAGLAATLVVAVLSNISLPHSAIHFFSALFAGATLTNAASVIVAGRGIFDYAFTPDAFPLILGFVRWRDEIGDPMATISVVGAAIWIAVAIYAAGATRKIFYPLFCIVASCAFAFAWLWFKDQEFATYKIMLLMQPFVCLAAVIMLATWLRERRLMLLALTGVFCALNLRVSNQYALASVGDVHPIPRLAGSQLLDKLEAINTTSGPIVLDLQSYLFQQYATLRPSPKARTFAADLPNPILEKVARLPGYHALVFPEWFLGFGKFVADLNSGYQRSVSENTFGCGPAPVRDAKFQTVNTSSATTSTQVYAGGILQPFNRSTLAEDALVVRQSPDSSAVPLVVQRESSLGGWDVSGAASRALRSVFFGESDPMGQVSTMSAVGRYVLLELVGSGEGPQQFRLRFTRSFFGADGAQLPKLVMHGSNSVAVAGHGAGSLDITTDPITPCIINQRRYVMIDFGAEPLAFRKSVPLVYRAFGLRYSPDARRVVGFLRDVSIAADSDEHAGFTPAWAPKTGGQVLGYVGLFEDGWLSDDARIVVRPSVGATRVRFVVEVDPVLLNPAAPVRNVVMTDASGQVLGNTQLIAGSNMIDVVVPSSGRVDVRLKSDGTMPLPGGDGRRVAGRLVATLLE